MKSDTPLDYAVFQLSPKRSRCDLFGSSDGKLEKLASGFVKPFVTHLKVAEEQVALSVQSIKLEVERRRHAETWFTKGTLERFVRYVSTPEILELVSTFDVEMSQLEAAQRLYSQGAGDQLSGKGGGGSGVTGASDATKKELLRAIDVRLAAVKQDLTTACTRAAAAGFNLNTVSDLQAFADRFGAHRLNEACNKFISLCERRPGLIEALKGGSNDRNVRSSYGSDMSIDEDPTTPEQQSTGVPEQIHSNPAGQPKPSSIPFPLRQSRESSVERGDDNGKESISVVDKDKKGESSSDQVQGFAASQPTRRLSVKDRISLFESQKKEDSGSGSGGKPIIVGKSVELRRQSSDVPEKAVLRRWSGASDMSIDLSGDKRDIESPLCTPSTATASQAKSEEQGGFNSSNLAGSGKPEFKSHPDRVVDSGLRDQAEDSKNQANSEAQFKPLHSAKAENSEIANQGMFKGPQCSNELSGSKGRVNSEINLEELKDQGAIQSHSKSTSKVDTFRSGGESDQTGRADITAHNEELEFRDQIPSQSRVRVPQRTAVDSGQSKGGSALRSQKSYPSQNNNTEGDLTFSQSKWRSLTTEEAASSMEDSRPQKMKIEKRVSDVEQVKVRAAGSSDESTSTYGNSKTLLSGKKPLQHQESPDSFSAPLAPLEQRARQSKGNQELNDELKMKANELEKLFAEHKLRAPGDSSSTWRSKDMQSESTSNLSYQESLADDAPTASLNYTTNFDATPPMKTVEHQGGDALCNNFSELSFSEGSRGRFYDSYMQKRNEKLKEEWSSKRVEKEAKLKAMQDSFERSRAEIEAKFSGSIDRQDSVSTARRRAERLRSFNTRSYIGKQQRLDFGQSDEEEDLADYKVRKIVGEDRDDISRSATNKKLLSSKSLSATPRTSAAPIPRSASKASNTGSGRRKMHSDNPLIQSVPNFPEMRKENTKPSSAASKPSRPQPRNYARSKSINDETPIVKEDKSRRSQSLRKSYAVPGELTEMTPVKLEDIRLASSKFGEETEQSPYDRFQKHSETKSFLRKGSGKELSARSSFGKQKVSTTSDILNNEEENDDMTYGQDSVDILNNEEDEFETIGGDSYVNMENRDRRLSEGSEKMIDSGSENDDPIRSFAHIDSSISAKFPAVSGFPPLEHMNDSPEESPMSWNLQGRHPFSYTQDISDVDASGDSPLGSPVSWNSHSLSQMETDAARMRKKWGTAQKPMLVTNSSNTQSRKDMTSGFKRLLKFGRKSRGTENLVDWMSVTTSEGDDDTEDGRDPANRSSEDLRKSRMGLSQGHPSDDSFNDNEFYNEQVQSLESSIPAPPPNFKLRDDHLSGSSMKAPRSFFSLSTFRSKGSDSKPR